MRSPLLAGVLVFGALVRPAFADAGKGERRLRLDECVDLALKRNVEVKSANEEVTASESERTGARGGLGPAVRVDAYAHEWNAPFNIPFGAEAFPVRDQFEWNVTVSAVQPVTGLFAIFDTYKIKDLGVDIANVKREVAKRDTAYQVAQTYYRLNQAKRLVEVAKASVEALEAQLKVSNAFHDNGVVSQDDVLRAQLAVANAKQRLIQSNARVSLEQSRLGILIGEPDVAVDPLPFGAQEVARDTSTVEEAQRTAESQRLELAAIDKRIEQADKEKSVAFLKLVPQISVVGAYIHNEGSVFQLTNSGYVGAQASWDVWDWGKTSSGIGEAKSRFRQAQIAREKVNDQIKLEVRQAFLELSTATDAMTVAKAAVASAEENFRLVKKRYEASAATSFDVVDAESLLTQARGQMQTALYDQLVARAALRRAMGASPEKLAHE